MDPKPETEQLIEITALQNNYFTIQRIFKPVLCTQKQLWCLHSGRAVEGSDKK
jgi:hypothetical protein